MNKGSNSKSRGFLTASALTHLALEFSVSRLAPLVYDNLNTSVPAAANSPARVCSAALGLSGTGTAQVANCTTYTIPGSNDDITFSDLQADPEAPYLVLHRVDVQYTIRPLFAGSPFNLVPQLTLHRTIVMRAMP